MPGGQNVGSSGRGETITHPTIPTHGYYRCPKHRQRFDIAVEPCWRCLLLLDGSDIGITAERWGLFRDAVNGWREDELGR